MKNNKSSGALEAVLPELTDNEIKAIHKIFGDAIHRIDSVIWARSDKVREACRPLYEEEERRRTLVNTKKAEDAKAAKPKSSKPAKSGFAKTVGKMPEPKPWAMTAPKGAKPVTATLKRGELQSRILESLSKGSRHIDDIAKAVGGKVTTVASVVSKMAAKGAIKKLGDGMYEAVKP